MGRLDVKIPDLIEHFGDRIIFQPEHLENCDKTFERVLALYPDMRVEMDTAGNISLMLRGSLPSCAIHCEVFRQMANWAERERSGRAFNGTVVFNLSNGAKMSPDASWVAKSVLEAAGKKALSSVTGAVITPVFVVEVRSFSDRPEEQIEKCESWIEAGVQEAWMVDPIEHKVHIFRPGHVVKVLVSPEQVKSAALDGFVLKCAAVWEAWPF